jgi:hypothetical protein
MATVTASFYDRAATERAVDDLVAAGIPRDDISVVMSNETRDRYFAGDTDVRGANIAKGAAGGGAIGGSLGAIAGGLLLGGTITAVTGGAALPFLIAGPIAGALAGGGAGAAVGSILGALVGAGVPEHEARAIESDVQRGGVVIAVHTDDARTADIQAILRRDGGGIEPGSNATVRSDWGAYDPARPSSLDASGRDMANVDDVDLERTRTLNAVAPATGEAPAVPGTSPIVPPVPGTSPTAPSVSGESFEETGEAGLRRVDQI